MKTTLFTISALLFASLAHSQVGINTQNPRQMFHVDGQKDNPATGNPTTAQQSNDVVLTAAGRIGIGTTNPSTKLEINNGTTAGAIKIVDGTQAESKVLMSDENGVGTWQTPASIRPTINGRFPSPAISRFSNNALTRINTNIFISLPKGKWIVNAGLTIESRAVSNKWLHFYLSSTNTNAVTTAGFKHLGPAATNTAFAGKISTELNFLPGSSVIEVTAENVDLYLVIETLGYNEWSFTSGAYENYLYAIPIN